ncbi:sensor histidine kinase [Actinomadura opuntiae]|uniref:sensor histidine kinase n=1 Tax=Actinomadura sp. OS1-43 TaxID=604315 RepID=UPI00255B0153|nr:nitrate- and nitrite sensing domain-containing protein [Actinomadura sp. OS1-43]MDL4819604.1 nitrate- and nitrite sensing domain-containing protein [Actinomadura sp. OS1-43]
MPQRLIVLILVPTLAAVALAGLRISDSVGKAQSYGRVERMAELGEGIAQFVQEFTAERDEAVEYITAGRPASMQQALQAQQQRTDAQVAPVRTAASRISGSYGAEAVRDATAVESRLDGVKALRSLVTGTKVPAFIVLQKYTDSAQEMIAVLDGISQNVADDRLAESSRALGALARAKEAVSRERAILLVGAREGGLVTDELNQLTAARAQEDSELAAFRDSASLEQTQLYEDTVVGPKIDQARDVRQRVISAASANAGVLPGSLRSTRAAKTMRTAMTAMVDQMRQVEQRLAADIRAHSDEQGTSARNATILDSALVAVLLLIVLLITIVMARSLVRPLRRLQSGALEVASTRLPGLVDRLRDPEAAAGGIEVAPIEIDSTDEIGQVARAFDEVHREAVRLAADEAVLRGNINAMFVNLSRRSQSLIERQLRLIEELEQSERDEEQLGSLFRLDHLATRMRRNCENLLVLGGQEQARRWNKPVPLIDVVRASLSEVEQYERVALRVQGDMTVAGPVVNDLVHLLAELVENALVFSSEHTKVTVSGQLLSGGGSMLQITDNGVGMSQEELEQANWRLANPPVIDFSAARRMGLFVVGRLAVRHGIRVELRAAQGGGLTAFVVLPDAAVTPGEPAGVGVGARGLGVRDSGSHGQLTALTTTAAEPPSTGASGAFRQDDFGPAAGFGTGTGGNPMVGHTGPLRPLRGATGPQPAMGGPVPPDGTGPQSPLSTGPLTPTAGSGAHAAGTGAHAAFPNTGPLPAVPPEPRRPADAPPPDDPYRAGDRPVPPRDLPVRRPGAQLHGRQHEGGPRDNVFEPPSERAQQPEANGFHDPADRRTGPQPVVPEAQPVVPEPGARRQQIPWETGPLDQVPGDTGPHGDLSRNGAPGRGPGGGRPQPPRDPVPEHHRAAEPSGYEQNGYEQNGYEPNGYESNGYEQSGYERSGYEQPAPAARQAPPSAPAGQRRPRVPERSPIFDAMQSEWFQRRTGGDVGEDPVKGWESPADEGFRAAEAAREPVAGSRTQVGLPKRVPGKNRIPGAVGRTPAAPAGGPPQPAAQPPAAPGRTQPVPRPGAPVQGQQSSGQSADVVRNRFASLQRGVHRGRNEARGGGTSGEVPSQGDGETGGTR